MELMYITNNEQIALYAQSVGVDRIFIDLESIGKKERQGHLDTVISEHNIEDISIIKKILDSSKLLVRVNPVNQNSKQEIKEVIDRGADIVMLPMFKTQCEVENFVSYVNKNAKTSLLLETSQALTRIDEILEVEGIDEIHIGLNDLHLSMQLDFMFELLSGGIVDYLATKIKSKGIKFGFGGIARMNTGMLSAELILSEHYRLGSEMVILSREFHGRSKTLEELKSNINLDLEIKKIREYQNIYSNYSQDEFKINHMKIKDIVSSIVKNKQKLLMEK